MNTNSVVGKHKRKRKRKHNRSLNEIPDEILSHILSFLPTKISVQTSVLSKRWQNLWTTVPNLDFYESRNFVYKLYLAAGWGSVTTIRIREGLRAKRRKERKKFMDSVDKVLIIHKAPTIEKFSLSCNIEDDVSRIKTWISAAVNRNPRELDLELLNISMIEPHVLPHCLFMCETLEVLKMSAVLQVLLPSQIYLPRLKILTLKHLHFENHHATNRLFASPALEELVIENCIWEEPRHDLIISAPNLQRLTIEELRQGEEGDEVALCSFTISAPALEYFCYSGGFIKDYHLSHTSSILTAALRLPWELHIDDIEVAHFEKVLKSLQSVKYLDLSTAFVQVLSRVTVPTFENVVTLEISERLDPSCEELEMIVDKCRKLETLRFSGGISEDYNYDRLLYSRHRSYSLKKIVIEHFLGGIKESSAVHILLSRYSSFLETMEISFSFLLKAKGREEEVEKVKTFLMAIPRRSKYCKCKLEFSWSKDLSLM